MGFFMFWYEHFQVFIVKRNTILDNLIKVVRYIIIMLTKQQRQKIHLRPLETHPPKKYKEAQYLASIITQQQKIYIALWLDSLLQPWTKKFYNALNKSQKLNMSDILRYAKTFYSHLDEITIYYIMGCLMDIAWFSFDTFRKEEVRQECKYLNILIEEMSAKYFREHQWYSKIQHLPIFMIFTILDIEMKGYVSLKQLSQFVSLHLNKKHRLQNSNHHNTFLIQKFKQSEASSNSKITQQNLDQLLQRLNITNFIYFKQNIQKSQSLAYDLISHTLILQRSNIQLKKDEQTIQQIKQIHRQMQGHQVQEYNQMIKNHAINLSKNAKTHKIKRTLDDDNNQIKFTFAREEDDQNVNHINQNPVQNKKETTNFNSSSSNKKQNISQTYKSNQYLTRSRQNQSRHLALKQSILTQLYNIKRQKHDNKSKLVQYI